jgi:hypothetical protein
MPMKRSWSGSSLTPLALGGTLSMFQSTSSSSSFLRSYKTIDLVRASSDSLAKFSRQWITQQLITLDFRQAPLRMHPVATKLQNWIWGFLLRTNLLISWLHRSRRRHFLRDGHITLESILLWLIPSKWRTRRSDQDPAGPLGISFMPHISSPEITVKMRCSISPIPSSLVTHTALSRGRLSRANRPLMKSLKIIRDTIRHRL